MINGKQRSYLKALANSIDPIFQVGKNGVTESFLKQVDDALEARELVKINVLNNSLLKAKNVAIEISEKLNAEFVQSIGNKFVVYRESKENKNIELP